MKLKEKELNKEIEKLSQLDRIEFLLKIKEIKEKHKPILLSFIKTIFLILGFLILLAISSYNLSENLFISVFSLIRQVSTLAIYGVIFCFLLDFINYYFLDKKKVALVNKFFTFKVDTKNKHGRRKQS